MDITLQEYNSWHILHLSGNIMGKEATVFKRYCEEALDSNYKYMAVDMKQVELVDSTGLGALIRCHQKITAAQGKLVLMRVSSKVQELLAITSVDTLFTMVNSETELT
jgi:anti-anti-sigma factor